MSVDIFKDFINSNDFNKVFFDEYDFYEIENHETFRILKRTTYKLHKLLKIEFPFVLFKIIEEIIDKINIELFVKQTYTHNNVKFYCNVKSDLEHYKFIEDIYYNVDLKFNNNIITIETSIDKKYDEKNINEIDKLLLNILLAFIENNFTSYVKNEIFKKKLQRINHHSFELNII